MRKSLAELKEDFRSLRTEMYASSESTDLKLLASYLDRLIISLENLTENLEGTEASIDSMNSQSRTHSSKSSKKLGSKKKHKSQKRSKKR